MNFLTRIISLAGMVNMIAGAAIFAVGDVAAQLLTIKRSEQLPMPVVSNGGSSTGGTTAAVVPTGGGGNSRFDRHRLSCAAILGCVWSGICVPAVYSLAESLFPGRSTKKILLKMVVTCSILSTVGNYTTMLARRLMMLLAPGAISNLGKGAAVKACVQDCNDDIPEVIMDDLKIWPLYDIACFTIVPPPLRPITTAVMSSLWATYMSVVSAKTRSNLIRQKNNYDAIRDAGGKEMVNDIYIREVGSETFWFIGKVARISDVSVEDTISKQWPLIQMHASHLRPIKFFVSRNKNEIWYAPGDSELDVAYYRPNATFVKVDRNVEGVKAIKVDFVGFEGKTYTQDEDGFRTLRTDDGKPAKPEVIGADDGGSNRAPTAEEMADLEKALIDQDLGDVLDTDMGDVLEQ